MANRLVPDLPLVPILFARDIMDIPKRAQRRHHRQRMIAKVKRLQRDVWNTDRYLFGIKVQSYMEMGTRWLRHKRDLTARKLADNLAFCRRMCCRNPRRDGQGPPMADMKRQQPEIHQEPCDECGSAWNENCEPGCPYQRTVRFSG